MSHFYTASGECITGLREARKRTPLPLPSPTTVLSMLRSEGLLRYFKHQMHVATATTPRQPHWSDDEYFEACTKWADEHGRQARDKGGDFHDQVERFHAGKPVPLGEQNPMLEAYAGWHDQYVDKTIATEMVVAGDGFAGRLDHLCLLKDGRIAVSDVKTQAIKNGRFNFYFEWSLQMGAYGGAVNEFPGPAEGNVDVLVSVCISSKPPFVVEAFYWPEPVAYYHDLFLGLLKVWKFANDYDC